MKEETGNSYMNVKAWGRDLWRDAGLLTAGAGVETRVFGAVAGAGATTGGGADWASALVLLADSRASVGAADSLESTRLIRGAARRKTKRRWSFMAGGGVRWWLRGRFSTGCATLPVDV